MRSTARPSSRSSRSPTGSSFGSNNYDTGSYRREGEQGQSILMDRQATLHRLVVAAAAGNNKPGNSNKPQLLIPPTRSTSGTSLRSSNGSATDLVPLISQQQQQGRKLAAIGGGVSYGSTSSFGGGGLPLMDLSNTSSRSIKTIRFQVVVWYIGKLDVVTGSLPMTFRVTLFWNDDSQEEDEDFPLEEDDTNDIGGDDYQDKAGGGGDDHQSVCSTTNRTVATSSSKLVSVWKMAGRQRAFQEEISNIVPEQAAIAVPALSILNVATFEMIGAPEVEMLRPEEETRLMRWTCMYRATVVQEQLRVDEFPHDKHDISLHLAILNNRHPGQTWDKRIWKLALANADDTQHSTRIPYGLVVDQVRMPDFQYNKERGLDFSFCPLNHGSLFPPTSTLTGEEDLDMYLKVSLAVLRDSGYYDKNIVPLLALLNVVAVSVVTMKDTDFFNRGLLTMNIAFVEMGIRMTADSHLPSVGYEIRLQRILNEFFVVLMLLVLEANLVYVLREYHDVSEVYCKWLDWAMGIGALLHNAITLVRYYHSKRQARNSLYFGWKTEPKSLQDF
jgi:hypothetical protein